VDVVDTGFHMAPNDAALSLIGKRYAPNGKTSAVVDCARMNRTAEINQTEVK